MDDELNALDRELKDLGAHWRAANPPDFVPAPIEVERRPRPGGWWLAGAAAAAVVVAILGTFALLPDGDHGATPSGSASVLDRLSCDKPTDQPVVGAPAVPEGAIAARLCGRIPHDSGFDSVWPGDILTGAAAADLAARLNALEPYSGAAGTPVSGEAASCRRSAPSFNLVLRYPGGGRVLVQSGGSADCELLSVYGGGAWVGASGIRETALAAIERRRTERGPLGLIAPLCPKKWALVADILGAAPVTAATPVAVTACQYRLDDAPENLGADGNAAGQLEWERIVREPGAIIGSALAGNVVDPCGGRSYDLQVIQRVLIVRDGYGDIQVVSAEPCWPSTLTGAARYPSSALAGQLAALAPR